MELRHELLSKENVGLAWRFSVSPSSCDNPFYYSNFLKLSAVADANAGLSVTHILIDEEENELAGYISLRATSLMYIGDEGKPVVKPTLEIAELAVAESYERKGVGKELFSIAIGIADRIRSETLGIQYVAVCADPNAVGFYEKLGFSKAEEMYQIPRDGWNDNCVPMYIRLPEL